MKKHIILCILLCIAIVVSGCGTNDVKETGKTTSAAVSDTDSSSSDWEQMGDFFGEVNELKKDTAVDYSGVTGEEYRIRSMVEAVRMYVYSKNDTFTEKEIDANKYGINDYVKMDDWVSFNNYDDMETVLENKDFQRDFYNEYGISSPNAYSLFRYIIPDTYESNLLFTNKKYYFSIEGSEWDNAVHAGWGIYYCSDHIGAEEIANMYAKLDGLELKSETSEDGNTVYYFTADNGCTLFKGMAIATHEPTTAYIWEQGGFIGVLVISGEHKDDNLSYCLMDKLELEQ